MNTISKTRNTKLRQPHTHSSRHQRGFTIIEVTLVLAIAGMLLVGAIAGTFNSIKRQRYNDAVQSFAEYLRTIYGEVISPESLGNGVDGSFGTSNTKAIYGKVLVFGLDPDADGWRRVYSATLVGNPNPPEASGFVEELKNVQAELFCGSNDGGVVLNTTVSSYLPLWETQIDDTSHNLFTGTVIIARAPSSGVVHTAYAPDLLYDLPNDCSDASSDLASQRFRNDLQNNPGLYSTNNDINFCLRSEDSAVIRNVRIAPDGHNSSAISIVNSDDPGGNPCEH